MTSRRERHLGGGGARAARVPGAGEGGASSPQLPDDPSSAALLDGEWELIYTVAEYGAPGEAAKVIDEAEKRAAAGGGGIGGGEEAGKPRGIGGAVNATGLNVDTTGKDTRTTQTFDVAASRVANDIVKPFLGGPMKSRLQVSGPFTRSPANARRANVRFDTLELSVEYTPVKVTIGWLFPIVHALRPDERQESWLETTHLLDLRPPAATRATFSSSGGTWKTRRGSYKTGCISRGDVEVEGGLSRGKETGRGRRDRALPCARVRRARHHAHSHYRHTKQDD